jgi:hypothetical protein
LLVNLIPGILPRAADTPPRGGRVGSCRMARQPLDAGKDLTKERPRQVAFGTLQLDAGAARLPQVVGAVQASATGTRFLAGFLREIVIDGQKERPEPGSPQGLRGDRLCFLFFVVYYQLLATCRDTPGGRDPRGACVRFVEAGLADPPPPPFREALCCWIRLNTARRFPGPRIPVRLVRRVKANDFSRSH